MIATVWKTRQFWFCVYLAIFIAFHLIVPAINPSGWGWWTAVLAVWTVGIVGLHKLGKSLENNPPETQC